ncbi:polymerase-associated protein [Snakehead rhabdovirus]|uniref:Phosphoprotein n=1 Tax=Snakehead rhabdovirus TaxID=103603 RepID=PHOSP_SHRV|nr:polymerase-associated protein [Snakehead virus]Q9QJT8.1 RecName: Full=Phosphoprotein; Short=Protein P; AltName: Full=Protein M1 [Snakehead virus]AAD56767.1 polymerase-associated protein [Snakehead virus]
MAESIEMGEELVSSPSTLLALKGKLENPSPDDATILGILGKKTPTVKMEKGKGKGDPIEAFLLEFVDERRQVEANKRLRQYIRQLKMSHQEELTAHLERASAENRANLKSMMESQAESNKTTKTILATLITLRDHVIEEGSKKPRGLDKDQIKLERALGFERGYSSAIAIVNQLKVTEPSQVCKPSVRAAALSAMEKGEFESSGEVFKAVVKRAKAELTK